MQRREARTYTSAPLSHPPPVDGKHGRHSTESIASVTGTVRGTHLPAEGRAMQRARHADIKGRRLRPQIQQQIGSCYTSLLESIFQPACAYPTSSVGFTMNSVTHYQPPQSPQTTGLSPSVRAIHRSVHRNAPAPGVSKGSQATALRDKWIPALKQHEVIEVIDLAGNSQGNDPLPRRQAAADNSSRTLECQTTSGNIDHDDDLPPLEEILQRASTNASSCLKPTITRRPGSTSPATRLAFSRSQPGFSPDAPIIIDGDDQYHIELNTGSRDPGTNRASGVSDTLCSRPGDIVGGGGGLRTKGTSPYHNADGSQSSDGDDAGQNSSDGRGRDKGNKCSRTAATTQRAGSLLGQQTLQTVANSLESGSLRVTPQGNDPHGLREDCISSIISGPGNPIIIDLSDDDDDDDDNDYDDETDERMNTPQPDQPDARHNSTSHRDSSYQSAVGDPAHSKTTEANPCHERYGSTTEEDDEDVYASYRREMTSDRIAERDSEQRQKPSSPASSASSLEHAPLSVRDPAGDGDARMSRASPQLASPSDANKADNGMDFVSRLSSEQRAQYGPLDNKAPLPNGDVLPQQIPRPPKRSASSAQSPARSSDAPAAKRPRRSNKESPPSAFAGTVRGHSPPPAVVPEDNQYIVECLVDKRIRRLGGRNRRTVNQYLVKWKGYGNEYNSWVDEPDIHEELVKAYNELVKIPEQ